MKKVDYCNCFSGLEIRKNTYYIKRTYYQRKKERLLEKEKQYYENNKERLIEQARNRYRELPNKERKT